MMQSEKSDLVAKELLQKSGLFEQMPMPCSQLRAESKMLRSCATS